MNKAHVFIFARGGFVECVERKFEFFNVVVFIRTCADNFGQKVFKPVVIERSEVFAVYLFGYINKWQIDGVYPFVFCKVNVFFDKFFGVILSYSAYRSVYAIIEHKIDIIIDEFVGNVIALIHKLVIPQKE